MENSLQWKLQLSLRQPEPSDYSDTNANEEVDTTKDARRSTRQLEPTVAIDMSRGTVIIYR